MRKWQSLAVIAAALVTSAAATTATLAPQVQAALGAAAQACPPTYSNAFCYQVAGDVVSLAARVDARLSARITGMWEDGPEYGISAVARADQSVLHLVPRGEGQVLAIVQKLGATQPLATRASGDLPVMKISNPGNHYFLLLDQDNMPVLSLASLRGGTYRLIVSGYGRVSTSRSLTVPSDGLSTLVIPALAPTTPASSGGGLTLPTMSGYTFLVRTANSEPVWDVSALTPGYYDVFSYDLDGNAGPLAANQVVRAGTPTVLKASSFNAPFTTWIPGSSPSGVSSSPSGTGGRTCWVSSYTRANGTRVSGYYRSC